MPTETKIRKPALAVHQLPDHAGINAGQWFIGAAYWEPIAGIPVTAYRPDPRQKTVPRGAHESRVYWTADGRIMDEHEIAQGSGNRYRTVNLYDTETIARGVLQDATVKAVRALRKHEATCVICSNAGLQEECEARAPLAYAAAEYLTGIRS
jgi:hypothetical protein